MAYDRLNIRCRVCGREFTLATLQDWGHWVAHQPSAVTLPSAEHLEAFVQKPKWDVTGDKISLLNRFFAEHTHTKDNEHPFGQHQFDVAYENPDLG